NRGGPGSTRSQGEEGALSEHQRLPIPEQKGLHKALKSPLCQPQNLRLCWLHFPLRAARGQAAQDEGPCEAESTPQEET
ncbi:unnamed protein product, partial [Rangifer tarandus platyrhynchus]